MVKSKEDIKVDKLFFENLGYGQNLLLGKFICHHKFISDVFEQIKKVGDVQIRILTLCDNRGYGLSYSFTDFNDGKAIDYVNDFLNKLPQIVKSK